MYYVLSDRMGRGTVLFIQHPIRLLFEFLESGVVLEVLLQSLNVLVLGRQQSTVNRLSTDGCQKDRQYLKNHSLRSLQFTGFAVLLSFNLLINLKLKRRMRAWPAQSSLTRHRGYE